MNAQVSAHKFAPFGRLVFFYGYIACTHFASNASAENYYLTNAAVHKDYCVTCLHYCVQLFNIVKPLRHWRINDESYDFTDLSARGKGLSVLYKFNQIFNESTDGFKSFKFRISTPRKTVWKTKYNTICRRNT